MTQILHPDQPATDLEILELTEQPMVVVKFVDHSMNELSQAFDTSARELVPVLTTLGIQPVGPAIAIYHRSPSDTATLDIGVPVAEALAEPYTTESGVVVEGSTLPAGKAARMSYLGPYGGLTEAWSSFLNAVKTSGHESALPSLEIYVTEPTPDMDPTNLRTDLVTMLRA